MIHFFSEKLFNLLNLFSTGVPPELEACEFECRKEECLTEDFLTCSNRLEIAEASRSIQAAAGDPRIDDRNSTNS